MALEVADVCAWFQRQQGSVRLETIVSLLQMLYPLELQFVGAYLEDLARRDYHCLRDVEHRFNMSEMVSKLTNVDDQRCRSSLIVALSLLKSTNHKTAATVYRILLSFEMIYRQLAKTKDVCEEILLLLTMAKYHPAFRFDQKTSLAGLLEEMSSFVRQNEALIEQPFTASKNAPNRPQTLNCYRRSSKVVSACAVDVSTQTAEDLHDATPTDDAVMGFAVKSLPNEVAVVDLEETCPTVSSLMSSPDLNAPDVYITDVKVKGSQRKENLVEFTFQLTWSNEMVTECVKTQEDLYEFHRKLLDVFPSDAGCYGYNRRIPYFPGYRHSPEAEGVVMPDVIPLVYSYIQDFLAVNPDILASKYSAKFFSPPSSMVREDSSFCLNMLFDPASCKPSSMCSQGKSNDTASNDDDQDFVDEDGRVKSFVYYNSHISSNSPRSQHSSSKSPRIRSAPAESSTSCSLTFKTPCDSSQMTLIDGDATSASRVVPLPSPRTKDVDNTPTKGSQTPTIYVPKELYLVLRSESLLSFKKYFSTFKIHDLLNMKTQKDVDEHFDASPEDKKQILKILQMLQQEYSPLKNGCIDKIGRVGSHRKLESCDSDSERWPRCTRAPSTSSVDTNDTFMTNGDTSANESGFIGRSASVSGVYPPSVNQHQKNSPRQKSYHRNNIKSQLRRFSNSEQRHNYYGAGKDDSNVLSDSSCVSEGPPPMLRTNVNVDDDFAPMMVRNYLGFVAAPNADAISKGRGTLTPKQSNSLPPSKSQSPVPDLMSPSICNYTTTSFNQQQLQQQPFPQQQQHRKSLTPVTSGGGVFSPPINFVRGLSKQQQPVRCLYPDAVSGTQTPQQQPNFVGVGFQPPSMPPPAAYDATRPQYPPAQLSLPPPPTFGFLRAPPPAINPMQVISCQCNGTGTCQVCAANQWAAANGGMFVHFAAAPFNTLPPPQQQQQQSNNQQAPTSFAIPTTNFLLPPTYVTRGGGLTLDLNEHMLCVLPPPHMANDADAAAKFADATSHFTCCSNCGDFGHTSDDCNEATLDEITAAGQYHLNLRPIENSSQVPNRTQQESR